MKVKCNEIKIGVRMRKTLRHIDELASDIKEVGLLQPIGITSDNELVFGGRRLAACKSLDYEEIEVVIVDSDKLLEKEALENASRDTLTMTERVAIRKVFKEKFMKEKAELMKRGIKVKKTDPNLGSAAIQNKTAKYSGVSHATVDKENYIVKHGDQDTINKVDENELSVSKAYNLVKKEKEKAKAASENTDNETDTLPVEEPVEESIDPPIEPIQIEDDIYSITLSDNYDDLTLSPSLSNEIQRYSKGIETLPLTYIRNALVQAFGKE